MTAYFVTVIASEWIGHADSRCWGFFATLEEAEEIFRVNRTDIQEGYFRYGIIERVESGISASPKVEQWFKWCGVWVQIEAPKWAESITNWSIG